MDSWKEQHLITAVFALNIFRVQFRAVLHHICRIFMQNLHTESMECSLLDKLFASAIYYTLPLTPPSPGHTWLQGFELVEKTGVPGQKSKKASIQGKSRIFVWREMYKAALPLGPAKVTFWQEWIKAQIPRAVFTSANAEALILSLFGKAFKYNLKSGILLYQAYSLLSGKRIPLDASSGHQCNGPHSLILEKPH